MMVYKISIEITGIGINPEIMKLELSDELDIVGGNKSTDEYIRKGKSYKYEEGCIYLMHPRKICIEGEAVDEYEYSFIDFIARNYQTITKYGDVDINIEYEIYFSGDIFTIGIFDKNMLKEIANYNASISLSTYNMTEEEIKEIWQID